MMEDQVVQQLDSHSNPNKFKEKEGNVIQSKNKVE